MTPHYQDATVTLYNGDCLDVLRTLPDASVDSVVTDPPYLLGFMGREWDTKAAHQHLDWHTAWTSEAFRVLKPGGHLLAFGGTRTWHRLACAVEDAGFEIRDSIAWLYGSGFPKSLDVSKAIDKDNGRRFEDRFALGRHIRERREALGLTAADVNAWFGYRDGCQHWERQDRSGARVPTLADWHILHERLNLSGEHLPLVERVEAEREIIGTRSVVRGVAFTSEGPDRLDITAPATPDAERWAGWGTALKPAFEPIVVARKPLTGTVAANVLVHGTGALNIDACRIAHDEPAGKPSTGMHGRRAGIMGEPIERHRDTTSASTAGRWPANVVLDETQADELDQQSGESASPPVGSVARTKGGNTIGTFAHEGRPPSPNGHGDSGGASRFFYVAREPLDGQPRFRYAAKAPTEERPRINGIAHPTTKPLALMRWLVRLVTPPGGTVLEPFAGSGTTVEACILEGFHCIAIERETDYLSLIQQRINRRRDPVQAIKATGDDAGLFDLLDGGAA